MDKTHLDELVEYPAKVIQLLGASKKCMSLISGKPENEIDEQAIDDIIENNIFDYSYIDDTVTKSGAFVWIETEVPYVDNKQIKNMRIYVTIACHKNYMNIDPSINAGMMGNRRDNLARYIDCLLNNNDVFGIGCLKLKSATIKSSSNQDFTLRELCYSIPDFNIKDI